MVSHLPELKGRVRYYGYKEGVLTVPAPLLVHRAMFYKPQEPDFILLQPQLGQAVVIQVGGAQKALYAIPGSTTSLSGIKGFVCLALRHG